MILHSSSRGNRRGVSLVLVVVSLVSLMGVTAISLEGGLLVTERRNAQATADAARRAADFYWNYFANAGVDVGGTARASALCAASANGYTNDGVNTKVTVNIPPLSGDYIGKPAYTEVIVEYYHKRGFSKLFGAGDIPVRTDGSVGKPSAGNFGILVLDPTAKSALNANGGGTIEVDEVPIIVNSTSTEGTIVGGGSVIDAPDYQLVGNYTTSGGGTLYGPVSSGVRPMEDPLRFLPPPDKSTMTLQQNNKTQLTQGTTYLQPGVYRGGISASASANVILAPGIYYMKRGSSRQRFVR
jgi:hypothetical protein